MTTGPLTVMSLNIGNGVATPAQVVAYLRATPVDIVGLQEVDDHQAEAIGSELATIFPYQVVVGSGFSGRGILSRHPIVRHDWHALSPDRDDLAGVIAIGDQELTVVVGHPSPQKLGWRGLAFAPQTRRQIEDLVAKTMAAAPAVLLADLNLTPRHPLYRASLAAGLIDPLVVTPPAARLVTFPRRLGRMRRIRQNLSWLSLPPLARIDYILHSPDVRAESTLR